MDDVDLRDTSGRLRRLALAASIAALFTLVVMRWIGSVSTRHDDDQLASSMTPVLAIAMFVLTTVVCVGVLGRLARPRKA